MKKSRNAYLAIGLSVSMLVAPCFAVNAAEEQDHTNGSEIQTEQELSESVFREKTERADQTSCNTAASGTESYSESAEDSEILDETEDDGIKTDTEWDQAEDSDSDRSKDREDDEEDDEELDDEELDDGTVEDVDLICQKVYLEKEKAYALIDFTGDQVIEVSVDEVLQKKGHALHHVVIPVTLEKKTEITIQVEDRDGNYEISFIVIPSMDGFEFVEEDFPDDWDEDWDEDSDDEDWDEEPDGQDEAEGSDNEKESETTDSAGNSSEKVVDKKNKTGSDSKTGSGKSQSGGSAATSYISSGKTGSSDSGKFISSGSAGTSPTYSYSTSTDVVVEYTGRGKNAQSNRKESKKTGLTEKKQGQHIVSKKMKFNTGSANSTESLPDGSYAPSVFRWSGGTGKLKGIECTNINITGGEATATLVFASGYYGYIKIGDTIYVPTSQTESSTTFDIPVMLNTNMEIIAMTEAMSQPHEITYTIYVGLNDGAEETGDVLLTESSLGEVVELSDAPKYDGLSYMGSLKLEGAELFQIHFYDNDLTILEIDASGTEAEKTDEPGRELPAEKQETAEQQSSEAKQDPAEDTLYQMEKLFYLIIPEDAEIPAGIENDCILIQKPIDRACVSSQMVQELMEETGILDQLFAAEIKDTADIPEIRKRIEEGTIQNSGAVTELSMKDLLLGKCDLLITDSEAFLSDEESDFFWSGKAEDWISLTEQLQMLKIPLIVDRSSEEQTEEAQAEWEKVFLLLFGAEEADQ